MSGIYKDCQLDEIREFAKANKLSAKVEFFEEDALALMKICNGVGDELTHELLRKFLTRVYKFAEASVAIHDYDYHFSDGTPESQHAADVRFLANALAEVSLRYGKWWQLIFRWNAEWAVLRAYRKICKQGVSAWCVCFRNKYLSI